MNNNTNSYSNSNSNSRLRRILPVFDWVCDYRLGTLSRTCPVHGTALIRRVNTGYSEQFQDMTLVAPDQTDLERQAAVAVGCSVSPMQTYVEQRFAGSVGPVWLDGQVIDQATSACEMLGACLEYGAHCNLDSLTHAERDLAGAVGFEAAAAGPEGVRRALEQIDRKSRERWAKGAGPQARLGRIYQWLQFNKSARDPGPVRDLVREGARQFSTMRARMQPSGAAQFALLRPSLRSRAML